jgi:hypothetical protein
VSAVIDPSLREERPQITARLLRQFAALSLLVFGSLAVLNLLRHRPGLGAAFAFTAAVVGGVGLIRPRAIEAVFYVATALTMPIGWVVSRVLLGAVFFVVFTPIAMLFRAIKRDKLAKRFDKRAETYWQAREQVNDPRSYLHQA